ncbi:MBL fold metallo-hydrolase [Terricaulis sp.]|uniref:MBL fold metallo-hydrolase n=1 Tax=Terricaulis sp. TaxID=2768686 RepID=UPI003784D895
MTAFICETCGTQFAPTAAPPECCPICEDERQYVGWQGQRWTTLEALAARHKLRIEDEHGLTAIGLEPAFAINQRAFLLQTDAGNILWECLSIATQEGVAALKARGGVDKIVISHPHFYAAMTAWSEAFGGAPIYLHEADRQWGQYPSPHIHLWSGDSLRLSDDVTLIRAGGHFEGSTALHWARAPGGPALFPGDALQVVSDRRHVTFMYSYPNYIPMKPADVRAMRDRVAPYAFDNVFGYTWGRNIIGGGKAAVEASFARYFAAIEDEIGVS